MRGGVESARLHDIVNGESLFNIFCCLLCIFYCQTTPISKTGQFENLVFVIMSTRENVRLFSNNTGTTHYDSLQGSYWTDQRLIFIR